MLKILRDYMEKEESELRIAWSTVTNKNSGDRFPMHFDGDRIFGSSGMSVLYMKEEDVFPETPAMLSIKLTDIVLQQILGVTTLSLGLYLSDNLLSGLFPLEVCNLKNLVALGISNMFSGSKKSEIPLLRVVIPVIAAVLILSVAELSKATNEFSSSNMIGQGRYGSVYKGILAEAKRGFQEFHGGM
ncbi:hypothetical protein Q3G72_005000 [Acer saccharum]|nr:hypothetical protein Q3G72_005000 [Acer saccharum]